MTCFLCRSEESSPNPKFLPVLTKSSGPGIDTATFEITETEPAVKNQTASSSYKPAILSNGARIMVPPYISAGTRVVILTEDGSYQERAKD